MPREKVKNKGFVCPTIDYFVKKSKKPIEAIAADSAVPILEIHQYLNGEKDPDEQHLSAICASIGVDSMELILFSLSRQFRNDNLLVA